MGFRKLVGDQKTLPTGDQKASWALMVIKKHNGLGDQKNLGHPMVTKKHIGQVTKKNIGYDW